MELVEGETIAARLKSRPLPVKTAILYATQILAALAEAHGKGIVHRDLKPGNIMITDSGLVKILDFGLAKLTYQVSDVNRNDETQGLSGPMTIEGSILGTVSYMSPEQAEGRRIDARSDIFSFGLTLYEMLTGERAFTDASTISTLSKILRDEAKPISTIVQGVPDELEQIINRALRKHPDQRWQSMPEVLQALTALKQNVDSRMLSGRPVAGRKKPSMLLLAGAGVALAAALAGGGYLLTRHAAAPRPTQATTAEAEPAAPPLPTSPAPPAVDPSVLTNQSIVDMLHAKVAPSVIIGQIRTSQTKFDLTTAEIIRLTNSGATAELLSAMQNPHSAIATPATAAPVSGAPEATAPPVSAKANPIALPSGTPLTIALTEDVAPNPTAGQPLHFTVSKDLLVNDTVVVAKGTPVNGEIFDAGSKILVIKKKPTFRVRSLVAAGGETLNIRATPGARADKVNANIEPAAHHDKDKLAPAGSEYQVYVDGDQTVNVRH
jgi:serine/threonine-protein kinase